MPELSDEERGRRQYAVDFARGSVQLSGGEPGPEAEALARRYVEGELSLREYVDAGVAHARTLPKGEPVQEYFTSFEDAMKARPERLWRVAVTSLFPNGHRAETIYEGRHASEAAACDAARLQAAIDHGGSSLPLSTTVEEIG